MDQALTAVEASAVLEVLKANLEGRVVPAAELWGLTGMGPAMVKLSRMAGEDGRAVGGAPTEPSAGGAQGRSPRGRVTREAVLAVLTVEPQPTAAIAGELGLRVEQIGSHLTRLRHDGRVVNPRRGYWSLPRRRAAEPSGVPDAPGPSPAGEDARAPDAGGTPAVQSNGAAVAEALPERRNCPCVVIPVDDAGEDARAPGPAPAPAVHVQGLPWSVSLPAKPPAPRPTTRLDERDERLLGHLERTGPLCVGSLAWAMGWRTGEVTRRLRRLCYTGHVREQDGYWRVEG